MKKTFLSLLLSAGTFFAMNAGLTASSGATLQGFVSYDEDESMATGWYEFDTRGNCNLLWNWDADLSEMGFSPRGGWIRNGRLCMLVASSYSGDQQLAGFGYLELNPATGQILKQENLDPYANIYLNMISLAYVDNEDKVYGIAQDTESNTCYFVSAPASNLNAASSIARLAAPGNRAYSFAYSPEDDCFYGISYFDKLTRYSKDGTITELSNVPMSRLASERSAFVYSPLDGVFLYCPPYNTNGYKADWELYAVDPSAKSFEKLFSQTDMLHLPFMLALDNATLSDKSPAMPGVKSIDFTSGNLFADVTYTLPTTTHDGVAIGAPLSWSAKIDNVEFLTGTGAPGEDVTVNYTGLTDGRRALQLFVTLDGKSSLPGVAHVFAGKDTPMAPTNVSLTSSKVSWTAVTTGVNGEKIDLANLTYRVSLNGEAVGETSGTEYNITLDSEKPITPYVASVTALAGGLESEPGYSNKILFGKPFELPMYFAPTEEDFSLMTVYNEDGGASYGVWEYSERWDKPCFSSGWSLDTDADDWLILPGASFNSPELASRLSFQAACGGSSKEEYLEVWMGNRPDPQSMTIPIVSKTQIRSTEWETYENIFSVPEAGAYYIGFHSVSKPFQYSLNVCEIKVEKTDLAATAPRSVTDLKVKETSDAALTATITFTMPTADLTGKPLQGNLKAIVSCGDKSAEVTGTPGSSKECTVSTYQGVNIVTVVCEAQNTLGQSAEIQVFTGVDVPDFVENYNYQVSEDNMSVHLTWEAPLKGYNDGYFEQSGIQYYVGELDESADFIGEPILVGTDVFEFDYTLRPGDPMAVRYVAVAAANPAGISPCRWYVVATIGTPYTPPFEETFENMMAHYEPYTMSKPDDSYTASIDWAQPELIDPAFNHGPGDFSLVGYTEQGNAKIRINLPKFTTDGEMYPNVIFDIWNGKGRPSDVSIYATGYNIPTKKIATIAAGNGWDKPSITLPEEFMGKKWIQLSIDATLPTPDNYLILSGYSVGAHSSGVSFVEDGAEYSVEFFNVNGIRITNPEKGQIVVKKTVYPDGRCKVSKEIIR